MTDTEQHAELRHVITDAHPADFLRFESGFADRLAHRMAAARLAEQSFDRVLARQTRRLLPALVAASLAITTWNWWSVRDTADSPIAAAFGLRPVTLAAAVGSGVMFGGEVLQ